MLVNEQSPSLAPIRYFASIMMIKMKVKDGENEGIMADVVNLMQVDVVNVLVEGGSTKVVGGAITVGTLGTLNTLGTLDTLVT